MVAEMTKKIIKEKGLKHKYVAEQAGYTEKSLAICLMAVEQYVSKIF